MQRTVVMIDGTDVGKLREQGWMLEYPRVLDVVVDKIPWPKGESREITAAKVYLQPPQDPGKGWRDFLSYLRRQGYAVDQCNDTNLVMMHDLLVYSLHDKVDAVVLICGCARGMNGGFARVLQTVRAHGVQVEVWGLSSAPGFVRREAIFQSLEGTALLRAV